MYTVFGTGLGIVAVQTAWARGREQCEVWIDGALNGLAYLVRLARASAGGSHA